MIEATELRIGNWVNVIGVYKKSIDTAGIVVVDAKLIWLCEQGKVLLLPITLEHEILEKAGFSEYPSYAHKSPHFDLEVINDSSLRFTDGVLYMYDIDDQKVSGRPILYLHQLQNLYYALTGQELEIKSPL